MVKPRPDHALDIDRLLDEALVETFPASDPPAITLPHAPDEIAIKVKRKNTARTDSTTSQ